ncbi:hypothetical protein XENOCAPTIV_017088 [Xenoophorus captivus]|uniref:Uncharacterized protein n=1 Tax=Xenoophorus captivus TaxID=1517983 RepID=A0ABV0S1C2_9TELE
MFPFPTPMCVSLEELQRSTAQKEYVKRTIVSPALHKSGSYIARRRSHKVLFGTCHVGELNRMIDVEVKLHKHVTLFTNKVIPEGNWLHWISCRCTRIKGTECKG